MTQEQILRGASLSFLARKGYRGAHIKGPWRAFQQKCDHLKPDGTSNMRTMGRMQGCDYCSQMFRDGVAIIRDGAIV